MKYMFVYRVNETESGQCESNGQHQKRSSCRLTKNVFTFELRHSVAVFIWRKLLQKVTLVLFKLLIDKRLMTLQFPLAINTYFEKFGG